MRWRGHDHHHPLGWRHRLAHSLRWRLVAMFTVLALGVTLVFLAGTREVFTAGWRELARPLINDYVDRLAQELGSPPDVAKAQALVQRLPITLRIDGPQVHWQGGRERQRYADDGSGDPAWRGPRDPAVRAMLTRTTADGHVLVFGVAAWRWDEHPPRWFGWATLAGLLALTALAFAYVRHLFKPLDDIRAGALRFGAGQFGQPIPVRRHDELGELSTEVNRMADNLQHMLESQRGLLLAISHELRSPLTRARLNAELVADGTERDALLRDLALMRDLITDLLEGERLAAGHSALHTEPTDLNALVRDTLAERRDGGSALSVQLADGLPTLALDRTRIRLLVRNLLNNAQQHGGGAAVALATTLAPDGAVTLTVRDHGLGVPPEALARLAQPFYRPDAARSRVVGSGGGGVGLGLYLCRLVAQSHGGTLDLADAAPGLRVTLRLPAPPARSADRPDRQRT